MDHLDYYQQLYNLLVTSGNLIMQAYRKDYSIITKHNCSAVTSVDIAVEQLLKIGLADLVSDADFYAEDTIMSQSQADWQWIIDPLDGTKNFIKQIPHFCIMVALTYKDKPMVAAIYNPVTEQFYYAAADKGFWINGEKFERAVRAIDTHIAFVSCLTEHEAAIQLKLQDKRLQISRRYFGSQGMDAIYLATGSLDLLWCDQIGWWDNAPAILIIQEAQGLVCHYQKNEKNSLTGTLRAGNPIFFDKKL